MSFRTLRAKETGSRAQYSVEGIMTDGNGAMVPFYMMILPFHASFQTMATTEGEKLIRFVEEVFGPPSRGPETVKGGACGGEVGEIAEELDIHTAMTSVVWEGDGYDRKRFLEKAREVFRPES
ncbi:MAG: hypothetical protein D6713_01400 [Deltaproteobacteria bacterium]|nr:MAG: hypothetical protein D6713_01400 [Deltaproteobacteria bacterium]